MNVSDLKVSLALSFVVFTQLFTCWIVAIACKPTDRLPMISEYPKLECGSLYVGSGFWVYSFGLLLSSLHVLARFCPNDVDHPVQTIDSWWLGKASFCVYDTFAKYLFCGGNAISAAFMCLTYADGEQTHPWWHGFACLGVQVSSFFVSFGSLVHRFPYLGRKYRKAWKWCLFLQVGLATAALVFFGLLGDPEKFLTTEDPSYMYNSVSSLFEYGWCITVVSSWIACYSSLFLGGQPRVTQLLQP